MWYIVHILICWKQNEAFCDMTGYVIVSRNKIFACEKMVRKWFPNICTFLLLEIFICFIPVLVSFKKHWWFLKYGKTLNILHLKYNAV